MPKQPTTVVSDSYVRIFSNASPFYHDGGHADFNLFTLHTTKKETQLRVNHYKYETLNNVCRRLGVREFENGNYIGWSDGDKSPYDIIPIDPDDCTTDFKIVFTNLTLLNMKEILGGK